MASLRKNHSITRHFYSDTSLALPTVGNDNLSSGPSGSRSLGFDLLDNVHAIDNRSENNMLSVKPCGLHSTQKELGAVGVGSGVGHGQDSRPGVLQFKVLIWKLVPVNGFSSSSIVVGEISSLAHEISDDTVEARTLVTESAFTGAQLTEVLGSLWDNISTKFHDDTSGGSAANGDVKKNLWVGPKSRKESKIVALSESTEFKEREDIYINFGTRRRFFWNVQSTHDYTVLG